MPYYPPIPTELDFLLRRRTKEVEDQQKGIKPLNYYDTPADQQGLEKLICFTKLGLKTGFAFGVADVCFVSRVESFVPILGRLGYWTIPFATAAGAFVTTNYALAKAQKKDTYLNHIISAYVAGSVFGAKWNSYRAGITCGTILTAFALVRKYYADRNEDIPSALHKNPYYIPLPVLKYKWNLFDSELDDNQSW